MKTSRVCVRLQKLASEILKRRQKFWSTKCKVEHISKISYEVVWCVCSVIAYKFYKLVTFVTGITILLRRDFQRFT